MYKIAVIGECMAELYQTENNLYKQTFGGDTFNCSVYLKRSLNEAEVEYITVLGEDSLSLQMLDFFKKEQINSSLTEKIENKNPGLYIINTTNGERSFSYWRDDSAAKKLFTTKSFKDISDELLSFDLIYFSAITLAIMSEEGRTNLFKAIKKARANGVKIAYDSNYRPRLYKNKDEAKIIYTQALHYCDIFLPSIDDEKLLWGEITSEEIINKAKKSGCKEIVLKCGSENIIYNYENITNEVKTEKLTNIVDSTSAGDSFNGGYLASRLEGKSVKESIEKAKKLAGKVIMHQGAIIPKDENE